jgi:class 3 adenylate cyclase
MHSELVDRKITEHHGRIVKATGDSMLVESPNVVDAAYVQCSEQPKQATISLLLPAASSQLLAAQSGSYRAVAAKGV